MDTQSVDKALAAVRKRVEHDQAEAAMTAARVEEARRAAGRRETTYQIWLDNLRREVQGTPPRPQPYDWTAWGRGFY